MNDPDAPPNSIGSPLREKREYLGFSEEEVAGHRGLSESEFAHMETGGRQPGNSELQALAKLYGTSAEFLTGTD